MTRDRTPAAEQLPRESPAPELAPAMTRGVVIAFAAAAIGVNIALSLIDVWRLRYISLEPGAVRAALLATTVAIPLHIRHVVFGLRGERPPWGGWTLAALAIVNAVTFQFVGRAWIFQFASLAVSILIVAPGVWALLGAAVVLLSPLVLVGTQWYDPGPISGGVYLAFAITWRTATQFVPLRLMAATRALDVATRELEERAVVNTRMRIDADLRTGVGPALEQIVAQGEAARAYALVDSPDATTALRQLVRDSRRALADARRVVAGYRTSSERAELEAALALFHALEVTVSSDEPRAADTPGDASV